MEWFDGMVETKKSYEYLKNRQKIMMKNFKFGAVDRNEKIDFSRQKMDIFHFPV